MSRKRKRPRNVAAHGLAVAQRVARLHQQVDEVEDAALALLRLVAREHARERAHEAPRAGARRARAFQRVSASWTQPTRSRAPASASADGQCGEPKSCAASASAAAGAAASASPVRKPARLGERRELDAGAPRARRPRRGLAQRARRARPAAMQLARARRRGRGVSGATSGCQVALLDERAREAAQRRALAPAGDAISGISASQRVSAAPSSPPAGAPPATRPRPRRRARPPAPRPPSRKPGEHPALERPLLQDRPRRARGWSRPAPAPACRGRPRPRAALVAGASSAPGPRPLQPLAQAQLQRGGRVLGEGDGRDLVETRVALAQQRLDAVDEQRRLAGAGARFQHEARAWSPRARARASSSSGRKPLIPLPQPQVGAERRIAQLVAAAQLRSRPLRPADHREVAEAQALGSCTNTPGGDRASTASRSSARNGSPAVTARVERDRPPAVHVVEEGVHHASPREELRGRQHVERDLQLPAAAEHLAVVARRAAGLVVAQHERAVRAPVDAVDRRRRPAARGRRPARSRAARESCGSPRPASRRPKPTSKCAGVERRGGRQPRASASDCSVSWKRRHSRSQSSVKRGGLPATSRCERGLGDLEQARASRLGVDERQLAAVAPLAQEVLGDLVEEVAALERRPGDGAPRARRRREPQHVLQQVLEAAGGVGREPAGRDREARRAAGRAAARARRPRPRRGRRSASAASTSAPCSRAASA